ncbi:hypothetical protein GCM10009765_74500 [Fodinicola feengrottensis]|uniref:Uncharacterized protein n=2 Tax=Fodinicola feengrottensis TaxID=435914 RepID=A0ABP4UZJ9_9ACTN
MRSFRSYQSDMPRIQSAVGSLMSWPIDSNIRIAILASAAASALVAGRIIAAVCCKVTLSSFGL